MIYLWIIFGVVALFFSILVLRFPVSFTFVEEGTAKIVLQFGAFYKILLAKKGYKISTGGDIVRGSKWSLPGGLRFVGIFGIHKIHKKDFKWVKALPNRTFEDREEKGVDFILARVDYQYGVRVERAEDQELLPLNVEMIMTARVINPYKAMFAVKNWFDAVLNRIAPYIREDISRHSYQELIAAKKVLPAKEVMKRLSEGENSIIEQLRRNYGVEVLSLETSKINPAEEFRLATLQKWQAKRDAEKRTGSTVGALMAMISHQTNQGLEEIQTEFRSNPDEALKKYRGLIEMNKDFVEQQLAADVGALRRYYFKGGAGGMDLIALLGDVFRGAPGGGVAKPTSRQSSRRTPKKLKDMTQEERHKLWEEKFGKQSGKS